MTDSRPDENIPTTSPGSAPAEATATSPTSSAPAASDAPEGATADSTGDGAGDGAATAAQRKRRRRGSRGGRRRRPAGERPEGSSDDEFDDDADDDDESGDQGSDDRSGNDESEAGTAPKPAQRAPRQPRPAQAAPARQRAPRPASQPDDQESTPSANGDHPEMPERISEGRPRTSEAAADALVRRKPQIGDTRPAPSVPPPPPAKRPEPDTAREGGDAKKKRRRGGRSSRGKSTQRSNAPTAALVDPEVSERRKGRERNGRPIGRYLMAVQVRPNLTQVAVLEGRSIIEHYVSRPADDVGQIHGNIYVGRVQNVLPGMEAAFVDIGTPKNAVLYRGDVQYDSEDIVERGGEPRIEQILKAKQLIVCQVTKNPIGAKGARLTQEVSIPGRFVVLIPNSRTYGISKRLPDDERKRLRAILDRVKPAEHGIIVRTAAEGATEHELRADMTRLLTQWTQIEAKAKKVNGPALLYREPPLAVRVIREEFNAEYRGVVIDDPQLYEDVKDYVTAFNPELADRVELFDAEVDGLPLYERHHIHEQIHKALDRKVWLPSGGSLIIEHTEALTVIDVNTGKNVGKTNLEETVFRNNLEAAEEIARQLRLRDIGGIIVIDFIDMEIRENRRKVVDAFREALARDKTRTQVFDISELGLVEMTRKRIGEGLLTSFADPCPICDGRGVQIDHALLQ
jgi:ribonuclease E